MSKSESTTTDERLKKTFRFSELQQSQLKELMEYYQAPTESRAIEIVLQSHIKRVKELTATMNELNQLKYRHEALQDLVRSVSKGLTSLGTV